MIFRSVICTALVVGLLAPPGLASAKTPWAEVAAANKAAAVGRAAEARGDFAAALAAFEESGAHQDTPANRRRLARAKGKLGRLLDAQRELRHVLDDAQASKHDKRMAKEELAALVARIPKLSIQIPTAIGLTITLDGRSLDLSAASQLPLDPGEHEIRASAPDYLPYQQTFTLSEGESKTLALDLVAKPAPRAEAKLDAEPERASGSALRPLGYVSVGIGVVGLAVGGYFGLKAKSTRDDLSDACPADRCSAAERAKYDDGRDQAGYATVGFAVGGVGLLAGALLLMLAPNEQEQPASLTTVRLQPALGPGSLWLNGSF